MILALACLYSSQVGFVDPVVSYELPHDLGRVTGIVGNGSDEVCVVFSGSRRTYLMLKAGSKDVSVVEGKDLGNAQVLGVTKGGIPITLDPQEEQSRYPWSVFSIDPAWWSWDRWKNSQDGTLFAGFAVTRGCIAVYDRENRKMVTIPHSGLGTELDFVGNDIWYTIDEGDSSKLVSIGRDGRENWRVPMLWDDGARLLPPKQVVALVGLDSRHAVVLGKRFIPVSKSGVWRIGNLESAETSGTQPAATTYVGVADGRSGTVRLIGMILGGFPVYRPILDPNTPRTVVSMSGGSRICILREQWLYFIDLQYPPRRTWSAPPEFRPSEALGFPP